MKCGKHNMGFRGSSLIVPWECSGGPCDNSGLAKTILLPEADKMVSPFIACIKPKDWQSYFNTEIMASARRKDNEVI